MEKPPEERTRAERPKDSALLPKLCGADIELGNFILGLEAHRPTGFEASRLLLREIEGLPRADKFRGEPCDCPACRRDRSSAQERGLAGTSEGNGEVQVRVNAQDWGRKYLPSNGGCVYIDLDHLELCLPEVLSAFDHVACWHAMLRIARAALDNTNSKLPSGTKVQVLVNNSDGKGNSYGSHLNFLITRRAWDNIFRRKIHYMLYLAAFQASSIVYTGQGKVGSENGAAEVDFQLSQRADFFERLLGAQTTHNRPIVNSRDEPLCGRRWKADEDDAAGEMARMHVIFFDNTLCHVASLLKVGVMQIVLSMIEAEEVNTELLLDDPVEAVLNWSHDPTLQARAAMTSGEELTAVELQLRFLAEAKRFTARYDSENITPRAAEIIALWEDTLLKLQAGDLSALAPRLDWALKYSLLQGVLDQRPDLSWSSPEIKHLDHLYSSLDVSEGLYWVFEKAGLIHRVVSEGLIQQLTANPPEDTRAWTRAMLLRWAGPDAVEDVDWDSILFKTGSERNRGRYRKLEMSNPLAFTRAISEPGFENASSLDELLDALGPTKNDQGSEARIEAGGRSMALAPIQYSWERDLRNKKGGQRHERT
ncbi:MAG TPA: proteasome accessory factor PafA2 family protein [Blastocatellia bacterium]|nr:proteasome accessory factor PafA2 family protein [Blastocatellia bacterium]